MRYAILLGAFVLLAGCNGGTVDRHALTNDASTLRSLNCEGWLVARAAGTGRLTAFFVRGHAEELRVQAANFANALGTRPSEPGFERQVREAGREAGLLAHRLQRLHDHPSSRADAIELAAQFKQAGDCS